MLTLPVKNNSKVSVYCDKGNLIDLKAAQTSCEPFVTNREMGKNISWSGKPLDPDAIASPCGFKGISQIN